MKRLTQLALILLLAYTAGAQIITVTNSANSGTGSLRDVLAAAPIGATVEFAASLHGSEILLTSPIAITKDVDIIGPGPELLIISGGASTRLFQVTGAVAWSMEGLELKFGFADQGAAIYQFASGGQSTFRNLRFFFNQASGPAGRGGAIYTNGFTVLMEDCSFEANQATRTDGDTRSFGGAIAHQGSNNLTIRTSYFRANDAVGMGWGGGVASFSGSGKLIVDRCTFTLNEANWGGGIMCDGTPGSSIKRSTIYDNNASNYGGGIWLGLSENIAFEGNIVADNTASLAGPEILAFPGDLDNLGYNMVEQTNMFFGTYPAASTDLTGIEPEFFGTTGSGVAKTLGLAPCSAGINAGNPADNTPDQLGQAVYGSARDMGAYESQASLSALVVSSPADAGCGTLRDVIAAAPDGATITFDPSLSGQTILTGSEIIINKNLTIQGLGSDLITIGKSANARHFYLPLSSPSKTLGVKDIAFKDGRSIFASIGSSSGSSVGGGGSIHATAGTLEAYRCLFENNEAFSTSTGFGGAVYIRNNSILEDCRFVNNRSDIGGAVYHAVGLLTVRGCEFSENTATASSGAITASDADIFRSTFFANQAPESGALSLQTGYLESVTGKGNSASTQGGFIKLYSSLSVQFKSVLLDSNIAPIGPNIYRQLPAAAAPVSLGFNLIDNVADAGWSALATDFIDNPGQTQSPRYIDGSKTRVIPLACSSPAIHAGDPADMTALDQIGGSPVGPRDIGAYEQALYVPENLVISNANTPFVSLNWDHCAESLGATQRPDEYIVYRNGNSSPLGDNTLSSFSDNFPLRPGDFVSYEVEAKKGSAQSAKILGFGRSTPNATDNTIKGAVLTKTTIGIPDVQVCATPNAAPWGVVLDGVDDVVESTNPISLQPNGAVGIWVKAADWQAQEGIISNGLGTCTNGSFNLRLTTASGITITYGGCGEDRALITYPTDSFAAGSYHHLALSWEDSSSTTVVKLFVDGQQVGRSESSLSLNTSAKWVVGGTSTIGFLQGAVDEFTYWETAPDPLYWSRNYYAIPKLEDPINAANSWVKLSWRFENWSANGNPVVLDYAKNGQNLGKLLHGASLAAGEGFDARYCAVTEPSGNYTIDEVLFRPGGILTNLTVSPTTEGRFYNPGEHIASSTDNTAKNFVDTTVFVISGTVSLPSAGVLGPCNLDSVEISASGPGVVLPVFTDSEGNYAIAVPEPGAWTFSPSFGDHGFEPSNLNYNVQDDIIKADYVDTTTRILVGSFAGACGGNIFTDYVDVKVSSLETSPFECYDTTFQTNGSNTWKLRVPPFKYRITILNAYVGGIPDSDINLGLLTQGLSFQDTDLTEQNDTVDFRYKESPILEVDDFGTRKYNFVTCGPVIADSFISVTQTEFYEFDMRVLQEFDYPLSTITCPLIARDTAYVTIGDPATGVSGDFPLDSNSELTYLMLALNVNSAPGSATPEFSWPFTANAVIDDVLFAPPYSEAVVVEGFNASGSNINLTSPELPVMILRDPPGDLSFAELKDQGTRCAEREISLQNGTSQEDFFRLKLGVRGTIGVSAFGVTASITNAAWGAIGTDYTMSSQNLTQTKDRVCVTRESTYKTSDSEDFVGKEGDVFIGATYVQTFSVADDVFYSDSLCKVVSERTVAFSSDSIASTYQLTRSEIENGRIPQLEALIALEPLDSAGGPSATAQQYLNQLDVWQQVLANADSLAVQAFADSANVTNRTLASGSGYGESIQQASTGSTAVAYDVYFDASFSMDAGLELAGFGLYGGTRMSTSMSVGTGTTTSLDTNRQISFFLEDSDPGDIYSVSIGTDPVYGTNVFKLIGGQTSCPHEEGTVARDNGQMVASSAFAFVPLPYPVPPVADFSLSISNNSFSLSDTDRDFMVDLIRNPDGAIVRIEGEDPGEATINVLANSTYLSLLTIEKGSSAFEYEDITIGLFPAACPDEGPLAEVSVKVIFESPCPDVTLVNPVEDWVVNLSTGDDVQFTLTDFDAPSILQVIFEKRLVGIESNFSPLFAIGSPSLAGAGVFWDTLFNVSSLTEGEYDFRARVVCATGYTTTDFARGTINRTALQPIAFVPADGGTLAFGETPSITFNEDLFCGVVGGDNATAYFNADSALIGLEEPICGGATLTLPLRTAITTECEYENQWVTYTVNNLIDQFGNPIAPATWTFYVDRFTDPVLSLLGTNPSSAGGSDGSIDLTVSGGFGPYTYSWSNGATSEDLSGLPAGIYFVTVEDAQCSSVTDSFTLEDPTTLPAPPNDFCTAADSVGPGIYAVSTINATGTDISSCGVNDTASVWFYYVPTRTGTAVISTCGSDFDPVLTARRQCVGGPEFACNDNDVANLRCGGTEAAFSLTVNEGAGAYIRISGANGSFGTTMLTIEEPADVSGTDACAAATPVGPGVYDFSTVGATGPDVSSCGVTDNNSIWFLYTPTQSGTALVHTCGSAVNTVLSVRANCGAGSPDLLCNDDDAANLVCGGTASALEVPITAGNAFYIRVAGNNGAEGLGTLTIEEPSSGCSSASPPQNPSHLVEASRIRLQWDPIAESVACEVRGERLLPSAINGKATINAFEAASTNVPFTALGNGTTWRFRVRCACSISPVDATAYSVYDTFMVPAATREVVRLPRSAKLFPNPVTTTLYVDLQGYAEQTVDLQIMGMDGRVHVAERRDIGMNWETLQLPAASLAPGMYNLSIITKDGVETRRFQKADD